MTPSKSGVKMPGVEHENGASLNFSGKTTEEKTRQRRPKGLLDQIKPASGANQAEELGLLAQEELDHMSQTSKRSKGSKASGKSQTSKRGRK